MLVTCIITLFTRTFNVTDFYVQEFAAIDFDLHEILREH